jgi:hypothetical protein
LDAPNVALAGSDLASTFSGAAEVGRCVMVGPVASQSNAALRSGFIWSVPGG